MRKVSLLALTLAAVVLITTAVVAGASTSSAHQGEFVLQQRVIQSLAIVNGSGGGAQAGSQTRLLGALGLEPINADVWTHGNYAYVGTWSGPCPGAGVKIVDVTDPANPVQVATAGGYPHTSAEDMQVIHVSTASFTGDLLGIGIQDCDGEGFGGLDLWDVTDPTAPQHLGFYGNLGVHELSLMARPDGVFALLASPFSEPITGLFFGSVLGDFQLVDVTDPSSPVLTDDWAARRDGGFEAGGPFFDPPYNCPTLCRGGFPAVFAHSTSPSANGRTAYVAYWDLGAVVLDISDPTNILYVARTLYPLGSEGDTHSAVPNAAGTLLATTDEDFSPVETHPKVPGDTWGFARLWSLPGLTHLSDVTTPHSLTNKTDGFYSAHNPVFKGSKLYVSWYTDGVRIFDVSSPASPREVGFYRPRPHRGILARRPIPLVWGVALGGSRIYLSDMFFGLYVLEER